MTSDRKCDFCGREWLKDDVRINSVFIVARMGGPGSPQTWRHPALNASSCDDGIGKLKIVKERPEFQPVEG